MIKTRIASTTAAFVVGLAAIGGTALTIAVPANAAPSPSAPSASKESDQHDGKTPRHQHEQSKKQPDKFNPSPTVGPSSASDSTSASNQETDGPTVPRSWYPEMPHQGG